MLTKEYLDFRRSSGYIKPRFLDPESQYLLSTAEWMIATCNQAVELKFSRKEVDSLLNTSEKPAGAFAHLLQKRLEFTSPAEVDYFSLRKGIFEKSSAMLRSGGFTLSEYRERLNPQPATDIYGDLPENEICVNFKKITPKALVERYNLAQVQTLLLFAEKLEFTFNSPEPAKLRQLFKYLNFCRLLAEIKGKTTPDGKTKQIKLIVSGPLSLLSETRKYALQLATFFPAVLTMKEWKMNCDIKPPKGTQGKLSLDQTSMLKGFYRHYSAFVPEEIKMFEELFRQIASDFTMKDEPEFITLKGGGVIFPDFCFISHNTQKIYQLELFHRFHSTALEKRLNLLMNNELDENYLIGIDRSLHAKIPLVAIALNEKPKNIFLFRDFPGVERVNKFLNAMDRK